MHHINSDKSLTYAPILNFSVFSVFFLCKLTEVDFKIWCIKMYKAGNNNFCFLILNMHLLFLFAIKIHV